MLTAMSQDVKTLLSREDARRAARTRALQWGLGLGVALGVAPVIFLAIKGLVGLMVAGTVGLLGVNLAPVLAMKLANWKLRLLKGEARDNPIPTLENQLLERQAALAAARAQLQTAIAQIDSFVDKARDFAAHNPTAAPRWLERAERAVQLREQKKLALRTAAETVAAFKDEVERARTEWSLVEAEQAMSRSLDATRSDPMQQLLERTAIDSVRDRMNRAFASLETELVLDLQAPLQPQTLLTPISPAQPAPTFARHAGDHS